MEGQTGGVLGKSSHFLDWMKLGKELKRVKAPHRPRSEVASPVGKRSKSQQ